MPDAEEILGDKALSYRFGISTVVWRVFPFNRLYVANTRSLPPVGVNPRDLPVFEPHDTIVVVAKAVRCRLAVLPRFALSFKLTIIWRSQFSEDLLFSITHVNQCRVPFKASTACEQGGD